MHRHPPAFFPPVALACARIVAIAAGLLISAGAASAQVPAAPAQGIAGLSPFDEYSVDVWTTEDGLPQNSVNALAQTPDGYLWLGTFGGLVRFDGVRFTTIPRRDSLGLHLDRIVSLTTADSALWIGTERGILRYHRGEFDSWPLNDVGPTSPVTALQADLNGDVWFIAGAQLLRVNDGRFVPVADSVSGPLRLGDDGVLWVGDASSGGFGIDRLGERVPYPVGANLYDHTDANGGRWFSTRDDGLLRVDSAGTRRWDQSRLGSATPHLLVRDGADDYWIGTVRVGLHLFRPESPARATWRLPIPDRVGDYDLRVTFVDAEGTLWGGTNGDGLIRVRRRRFRVFADAQGFDQEVITTILEDHTGRMIVGTNCGGLYQLPPSAGRVEPFPWPAGGPAPGCVVSLAEDLYGRLWVGSYDPLLVVTGDSVREARGPNGDSLPFVHALHTAADGTVWAGALDRGLVAFPPDGPARRYDVADGLLNADVRFVTSDPDGTVWVGTTGGLGRLVEGRFDWFTTADGLPADFVRAVHRGPDGEHWIGTYGGGLARFKDAAFVTIDRADGLGDDVVSSILADGHGNLWMTGNRGIFRASLADLNAFADGRTTRISSVLYGREDGLLNAETNGGFGPASWEARDGRLWFPTLRGLATVDPARGDLVGRAPNAVIEAVLVDREPRRSDVALRVGPGRRNIELHYTGLSLTAPEHIIFRYRLLGFDDTWNVVDRRRRAYFPRLGPGRYTFEVQAANRDGDWGRAAGMSINVVPHVWETAWFRVLAVLTLLGGIAAAAQRRITGLHREQEARKAFSRRYMEGQESERRRVASELHDSIGQGLLVAKNRAALALRTPEMRSELRAHLDEIVEVVTETLEEARQISHNLRPHELDRLGLSAAVRGAVEQAADSSGIHMSADVDSADGPLADGTAIAVFRIVQEGLNNIMKHSLASAATVSIRRHKTPGRLVLTIEDDGRGIVRDGADAREGFGLSGIRERATLLGGTCVIAGAPGGGLRVVVTLPVPA